MISNVLYIFPSQVDIPADIFYPICFSIVVYFSAGLNPDVRAFLMFMLICSLNVLVGHGLGMIVSAIFLDVRNAQVLASTLILLSLVSSGYLIDPDNVPVFMKPLNFLGVIKYSYEALVRNEMLYGRTFMCTKGDGLSTIYSKNGRVCPLNEESVLSGAQLSSSLPLWADVLVLIVGVFLTRIIAYFALKLLHTKHKPRLSAWAQPS